MARDLARGPFGGRAAVPLRDSRARLADLRLRSGELAVALDLVAKHLVDRRGELVGAAVEEAGRAIVERDLGAAGDGLDLNVHHSAGRLVEQRPERAGEDDPLARVVESDPHVLDPAALGEALAKAPAGVERE